MTQQRRRIVWALAGWVAMRVPLYLIMARHGGHVLDKYGHDSAGDVTTYWGWVHGRLDHLVLPTTTNWQYPPLVAPLLMLPQIIPGADYLGSFVRLAILSDAVIAGLLIWTAARRGSWIGAWYWILAVPLLGPLVYGRFDIFSALFAVGALALLGKGVPVPGEAGRELNGRRWVAGALIGLGAAVKVWPGLMVFGLPRTRRGAESVAAAIAAGGAATGLCMLVFRNGTGFLHAQGNRGIEVESVWALPFLVAKHLRLWHGAVHYRYGSYEVIGHGVAFAGTLALVSTAAGFGALGWWWWRKQWRAAVVADATFVATLLMIVSSRVISPQYMVWLIAVAAFCLLAKDSTQRVSSLILLVSLPLTQMEFPYGFRGLLHDHARSVAVVSVRDLLLVAAVLIGFRSLWRSTVAGPVLPRRRGSAAGGPARSALPEPRAQEPLPHPAPSTRPTRAAGDDSVAATAQ